MTGTDDVSPLAIVEQRVQERATTLALAMEGPDAVDAIRALVDDEVARWNAAHARGERPFALADPAGFADRAHRNLVGLGPLGPLLADDDVWEVMINAPDSIFVKRHRGPSGYHDEAFHDDDHVLRVLTKVFDESAGSHRKLDPSEGLQDAQLDNGARLHIVHADIARGAHTMVNIRKFTGVPFRSLDELVEREMMTLDVARFLAACVRARLTILFAGAPGAGKTTLLSCCCAELDPALRVVVAEEVFEADVPVANVASMQTRPPRADRPAVDLRRLVAGFLRMAPDVAIVGEVRDREALPLLLTLSSGVTGYTTIHAGSARQALTRLRFICQLADTSNELPMSALNTLVSESIDLVVHCERSDTGPRVSSVVAVEDLQVGTASTQFTTTEIYTRAAPDRGLAWTGEMPVRAGKRLAEAGTDLRLLLGASGPASPAP